MKDFNDILNSDFLNSSISDELLAAYIDGNTTESENVLIENTLNGDSMLSEICEIASDSISFGSNFDRELHKGDFGFWELGLPPVVTEEDLSIAADTNDDVSTLMNEDCFNEQSLDAFDTFNDGLSIIESLDQPDYGTIDDGTSDIDFDKDSLI